MKVIDVIKRRTDKPTRKIVNLTAQVDWANKQLARTDDDANQGFKSGIFTMMNKILLDANCYQGYNYNYWMEKGADEWFAAGEPNFPEKDKFIYGGPVEENEYNRFIYAPQKNK